MQGRNLALQGDERTVGHPRSAIVEEHLDSAGRCAAERYAAQGGDSRTALAARHVPTQVPREAARRGGAIGTAGMRRAGHRSGDLAPGQGGDPGGISIASRGINAVGYRCYSVGIRNMSRVGDRPADLAPGECGDPGGIGVASCRIDAVGYRACIPGNAALNGIGEGAAGGANQPINRELRVGTARAKARRLRCDCILTEENSTQAEIFPSSRARESAP